MGQPPLQEGQQVSLHSTGVLMRVGHLCRHSVESLGRNGASCSSLESGDRFLSARHRGPFRLFSPKPLASAAEARSSNAALPASHKTTPAWQKSSFDGHPVIASVPKTASNQSWARRAACASSSQEVSEAGMDLLLSREPCGGNSVCNRISLLCE